MFLNKIFIILIFYTAKEANLTVVDTDYSSYACLYACENVESTHMVELAWILTRELKPADEENIVSSNYSVIK